MESEGSPVRNPVDAGAYWDAVARQRLALFDGRPMDAAARIQDELSAVERIACDLNERRNALAPVSRLSRETLVHIFTLCAVDTPSIDDVDGTMAPDNIDAAMATGSVTDSERPAGGQIHRTVVPGGLIIDTGASIHPLHTVEPDIISPTVSEVPAGSADRVRGDGSSRPEASDNTRPGTSESRTSGMNTAGICRHWRNAASASGRFAGESMSSGIAPSASALYWRAAAGPRFASLDAPKASSTVSSRLEGERLGVQRALAALRTRYNALAPISRLPRELLSHILALALTHPTRPAVSERRTLDLSHLCRQWRDVALAHARLWSDISFARGDWWAEEKLARARRAPIVFRAVGPHPTTAHHGALAAQHFAHTKELYLRGDSDTMRTVYRAFDAPAPYLEVISCRVDPPTSDVLPLPAPLLNGLALPIRFLELPQIDFFPWDTPLLSAHLVSLHITFPVGSGAPHPTLDEVLDGLARAPALVRLSLVGCLPPRTPLAPARTVGLPRLTHLALDGHVRDCLCMLKPLRLADGLALDIDMQRGPQPAGAAADAASFVFNLNFSPAFHAFAKLDLSVNIVDNVSPGVIAVRLWRVNPPEGPEKPPPDVMMHMRLTGLQELV